MCNTSPETVWIGVEREGKVRGAGRDPLQSGGLLHHPFFPLFPTQGGRFPLGLGSPSASTASARRVAPLERVWTSTFDTRARGARSTVRVLAPPRSDGPFGHGKHVESTGATSHHRRFHGR